MALQYPGEWKFEGVGYEIPLDAISDFVDLLVDIAENSKAAVERFKAAFGDSASSTGLDWAITDLRRAMDSRSANAAAFLDTLWSCIEDGKARGLKVPPPRTVNRILEKHAVPLRIEPPALVLLHGDAMILDSARIDTAAEEQPVPAFVLGEKLGSGGYGVVYRATRATTVSEFQYAVKVLDPSPFVIDHEKALRRFKREIKAMQSLQHRAIIPYYEAGLTIDKKPYIVMPLIEGTDLRSAASMTDVNGKLALFIEITNALSYAHAQDVLHRDLKPTNIVVRTSDRQPIVLDFGSAYLLDELSSEGLTSQVVGTIGYIPLEVLTNPKTRSPLQDVYACGVMLYECIAGFSPDPTDYVPLATVDSVLAPIDTVVQNAIAGAKKRTESVARLHSELADVQDILDSRAKRDGHRATLGKLFEARQNGSAARQSISIEVSIVPNIGAGATPGAHIRAVNNSAKTVVGAQFIVTNLRLWREKIGAFVTHPDIHDAEATFPEEMVLNRNTLHPGTPADFGFVRIDGDRLEITGQARSYRSRTPGTWKLSYRISSEGSDLEAGDVCFDWKNDSSGISIKPTVCPGSSYTD